MRIDPQSTARSQSGLPSDSSDDLKRGGLTRGLVFIALLGSLTTGIWLWTQEKETAEAAANQPTAQAAQVTSPTRDRQEASNAASSPNAKTGPHGADRTSNPDQIMQDSRRAYERGLRSMAKGHHAQAVAYLQDAIRLDPVFADAHYSLGLAYTQLGDHRSALRQRRRLQKLDTDLAGLLHAALE